MFVWSKEFPILGPGSQFAARAALASRRQGKYVPFHTALMQTTEQVTEETVMETAREAGLDTEQLRADMQDPAIQEAIARNLQLAKRARNHRNPQLHHRRRGRAGSGRPQDPAEPDRACQA